METADKNSGTLCHERRGGTRMKETVGVEGWDAAWREGEEERGQAYPNRVCVS